MFEIEFRTKFDSEKYKDLKAYLDQHAENREEDNKDCYYYIFQDKLLKIVNNISKRNGKISLKLNRIGQGSVFPEIEFYFLPDQFDVACRLFKELALPAKVMHGPQQRINYKYRDCEIALKYSEVWGYHMEIEQVIDSKDKRFEAEARIREVADELGVILMSEEELKKFTREAERKAQPT